MDDLETQGKKQEAERKAQERRASEKAAAEKQEAAQSIFDAPIKTETDWTVSILDSESRGRPQERIIREVEDTAPLITPGWDAPEKEVSPTRPLKDTTTAVGKEVVGGTFSEVYENRDKLKNGEITPLNVQSALMAYGLDDLSYAVQGLDLATGGVLSRVGETIDAGAEKAGTVVRRAARQVTGSQRFGQELGEYVCLGLMTANPFNKAMLPAKVTQKLAAVNNVVKSTKPFEVLNLGKAANVESKVLHGLDLAETGTSNTNILKPLKIDYSTAEAPFSLRIDPITGKGPMHIDSRNFSSATSLTSEGAARNAKQFWTQWAERYPETLSTENLQVMKNKSHFLAPKVDDQWVKHFPEHRSYMDQTLIHHHIEHGDLVTALPKDLHGLNPGREYFHTNLGGKK